MQTPQARVSTVIEAYEALGAMHARHRPLQALLLHTVSRGRLSEFLLPKKELVALDTLAHRLDIPATARREVGKIDAQTRQWVDAYVRGFNACYARPFELQLLGANLPPISAESLVSSLLLSSYLGLAEGQERMEQLILEAADRGADVGWLSHMFAPYLEGFRGASTRVGAPLSAAGGSNAWAVGPAKSTSGHALLAGDPHLQINQMPGLFLEVSLRVGDDYWMGASIPGLPAIAVGRNRHIAWAGTFGVADNVDHYFDDGETEERIVELRRRFRSSVRLQFSDTALGTLVRPGLSSRWFGKEKPAEAMAGYMRLPLAKSADEACRALDPALTLSLHWVIADRAGQVRYKHCGTIPRRTAGRLYPQDEAAPLHDAETLPEFEDVIVCSANEARLGRDGSVLSTLAQPPYRFERIREVLESRAHDVASFQALQHDLFSRQAQRLLPALMPHITSPVLRQRLTHWDMRCDVDSVGAHAFSIVYRAALRSLSCVLGGEAFWHRVLKETEVSVWWATALDRALAGPLPPAWRAAFALEMARGFDLVAWGEAQRTTMLHMVLAGVPGCDRGPFALPGSVATVRQGNLVGAQAIGPAYRFVTDLGEDCAYTALPGGISGSVFSPTYDCYLDDYWEGRYHKLVPP